MAAINITWDNTAVLASPIITGQRAVKRIKALAGAYDSIGFSPANDMAKSVTSANATGLLDNRVYQFKVQGLCTLGGPVDNANGPVEQIGFACINPTFQTTYANIIVSYDLSATDISKIRVRLRKQSDDTLVGEAIGSRMVNTAEVVFNGLPASTNYYVTVEFFAIVNGVEIGSSIGTQLNALCGGNVANFQVSTAAPPACPAPLNLQIVY